MTQQTALFHTTEELPTWARQLPAWLAHNLQAHQPGPRSNHAQLTPCPRCQQPTLHGWDGPFPATTDTTTLTNNQELAATILKRPTYQLTRTAPGITLTRRLEYNMDGNPAHTQLIVPAHNCGKPLGTPLAWETLYTPPKETHDDIPPF